MNGHSRAWMVDDEEDGLDEETLRRRVVKLRKHKRLADRGSRQREAAQAVALDFYMDPAEPPAQREGPPRTIEEDWRRSCAYKVPFASKSKAKRALKARRRQSRSWLACSAYRCRHCKAFHVGHAPFWKLPPATGGQAGAAPAPAEHEVVLAGAA